MKNRILTRKRKDHTRINREYKDRLFIFIFGREENKEWTLSLFNAVNGSDYDDPSLIEFNTLNDFLYMGMLEYTGRLYSSIAEDEDANEYGTLLIDLPVPKSAFG